MQNPDSNTYYMKNNNLILIIGQFSLSLGFTLFIINYLILDNGLILALLSGILFGLSLVFNLTYLVRKIRENKN